ncbi:MAG: ion transporter, partial [Pseudomonadota bacterium]|nr:ion transporter [Pseudomonadota bacterium]
MKRATLDTDTHNFALERFIERSWVRSLIVWLIIINAVVLGVLTYRETLPANLVAALEGVDQTITYLFVLEIFLKLLVYRFQFFRSGWNWFDFIVIGISLVPGS